MTEGSHQPEGQDRYEVRCATCGKPFDALPAPWCRCLIKERTLVCPHCKACFCKAARTYREKFWASAPQALWDRKMAEHRLQAAPPPNPEPADVARPLVLLVDDEAGILRLAHQVIREMGYGVIWARDGEEGLQAARLYKPDLVLSDALMPKMDGREMCRQVKADPLTAATKTVVMTSVYKGTLQRFEAMRAFQVDEYLAKPLEPEALAAVLTKLLGAKGPA